jgi:hypothetical protein
MQIRSPRNLELRLLSEPLEAGALGFGMHAEQRGNPRPAS